MQIHDANLNPVSSQAAAGTGKAQGAEAQNAKAKASAAAAGVSDAIELSSFAQQISDLQEGSPAREARVESLRNSYQSGNYRVDSAAVAAKIVDNSLLG